MGIAMNHLIRRSILMATAALTAPVGFA